MEISISAFWDAQCIDKWQIVVLLKLIKTNVSLLNLHFTKSGPLKMSQDFSSQVFFPFGSSHGDKFSKRFLRR